jgi:hypothetical protein
MCSNGEESVAKIRKMEEILERKHAEKKGGKIN